MAVIKDIIEGELTVDKDGYNTERQFIVTEVTGEAFARFYNASIAPDVPQLWSLHPILPNIRVTNVHVSFESQSTYRVACTYSLPDVTDSPADGSGALTEASIEVGATTQSTRTQKDKDGKQLAINITKAGKTKDTQVGDVEIQVPISVLQFSRVEKSSPIYKSLEFSGTVNDKATGEFAERTLLCTDIRGSSDNNGASYSVTYAFQYNPETWDAIAVYIDDETDKPHKDIDTSTNNGIGRFKIYKEKSFDRLKLDFGFANIPSGGFTVSRASVTV